MVNESHPELREGLVVHANSPLGKCILSYPAGDQASGFFEAVPRYDQPSEPNVTAMSKLSGGRLPS